MWGSLALIVAAHTSLGCGPLLIAGPDEQRDGSWCRSRRSGARRLRPHGDWRGLGRGRHTDDGPPRGGPRRGVRVMDGEKRFITNAGQAGMYVSRPARNPQRLRRDLGVRRPGRLAGVQRGAARGQDGLHASATGALLFENVRVPAANLLGVEGTASASSSRCLTAAVSRSARWPSGWPRPRSTPLSNTRRSAAVRPADLHVPGCSVHDRGHGDRDRGRPPARLPGRVAQGPGQPYASRRRRRSCSRPRSARGHQRPSRSTAASATPRTTRSSASSGREADRVGEGTSQVQRLVIARRLLGLRIV